MRFDNVSAARSGRMVLRPFQLEIAAGERFTLMGRSGSGKSTLLRLVNRLLPAASGTIWFDGQSIASLDPYALRRRIGFVPQNLGLFPHRTIRWQLEWKGGSRAEELLERVGLDSSHATRLPGELSGGQQQRVALARALSGNSQLLLLDEPFSALDPITRREMQTLVLGLERTTVLVTHDPAEALRLGQRIGFLSGGELISVGTPEQIRQHPHEELQAFWSTLS